MPQGLQAGNGFLGWDLKSKSDTIFDSGDREFSATTLGQVGKAIAAVLLHPSKTHNRYIHVQSFVLTQNRLLQALERVSGQKFSMTRSTVAEVEANANKLLAESDWDSGYAQMITAVVQSSSSFSLFSSKAEHGNKVLNLEYEEDLDAMVERVLKKLGVI